jgi:hypothetical protein
VCYTIIRIREAESHAHARTCVRLGNWPMVRRDLFLRPCNFTKMDVRRKSRRGEAYVITDLEEKAERIVSRDSSVGIATGYGLDGRRVGVRVPVGARIFSTSSRPVLGPIQPPILWVPRALSLEVKRPGRETDHSPSTSAEVKKTWIYTSTPPYAFMAWCLVS